jgi:hypothetical protein
MAGRVLGGGTRGAPGWALAAVLLLAPAAACSSGSTAANNGSGTPAEAARGFVDALLGGNPSAACDYVLPTQIPVCQANIADVHFTASAVGVGNTFTDGTQAVVDVEETRVCVKVVHTATTVCGANNDPNAGLPTSDAQFASVYNQAVNGGQAALIACTQVNGEWYVDTGAATTTGTTGPSGTGAGGTGSGSTGAGGTGAGGTGATGG